MPCITSALAFMLAPSISPADFVAMPPPSNIFSNGARKGRLQNRLAPVLGLPRHRQTDGPARYSQGGLRAILSVCTEDDCLQQGAPQTLAKIRKKAAKRRDVTVDTCSCLGMCGLGPCVTIERDEADLETRGGIDPSDDAIIAQLVEDATKPRPRGPKVARKATEKPTYDCDPYAEQ